MTFTYHDIAKLTGKTPDAVAKWGQVGGLPHTVVGRVGYVEALDWNRWAAANLYRDSNGRLRKRHTRQRQTGEVRDVDAAYRAMSIAELAALTESHPILQVQRVVRLSTYAARYEQGEPIFGRAQ